MAGQRFKRSPRLETDEADLRSVHGIELAQNPPDLIWAQAGSASVFPSMPPVLAENAINARPANAQAPRDYDRPESFLETTKPDN